jgi:ferredoxin-type protein NapF
MKHRKRSPRLILRLACFIAASVLLWPAIPWFRAVRFVLQLSPFNAICSIVALRTFGTGIAGGLALAILASVKPRFFCHHVCPTALLLEGAERIGFSKNAWWRGCPPIGKYAALLTIGGAIVGYPVLLWMDPLAIFSGFFSTRMLPLSFVSGFLSASGLGMLLLLSLSSGSIWCARICPLGGTQDLLTAIATKLRSLYRGEEPGATVSATALAGRRSFVAAAAGVCMGVLARKVSGAQGEYTPLRPPGSVEEGRFTGLCLRCGNCVRVCPSRIIQPRFEAAEITGLFAPAIRYSKKYCREDCRACTQVCPSGAIQTLSLEAKNRHVIGEALADGSLCILALGQKDCDACERACPFDAVHTQWDEEKYIAYPLVKIDRCNGCGACEVACPTDPFKAIRVWIRVD